MSFTVDTSFVNNYSTMLFELVRQKGSKLRVGARMENVVPGETAFFDQIDNSPAVPMGARHSNTPHTPVTHTRRALTPFDWVWNDYLDKSDKLRLLVDPLSAYTTAAVDSLSVRLDLILLAALGGNAYSGHAGTTAIPLPSTQIITAGATGMTLDKLREAKYKLDRNNVPEDGRFCCLSAKGILDLLADPNVTSSDFNTVKALVDGTLNTPYLGFTFIKSEYVEKTAPGLITNERRGFAWHKDGLILGMPEELFTSVDILPERNYSWQAYAKMSAGAVRMEEKRVVQIGYTERDDI